MLSQTARATQLLVRLERLPFSRWHKTLFAIGFVGVMFDATDFALFGGALPQIAQEFKLGPAEAGLLATIGLVGAFAGALAWGTISDYIGRRTAFQATLGIFAVFTGLVAASWSVGALIVFRFLSNFGLGGEVPVTTTLVTEFMPTRMRGKAAGNVLVGFPAGLALAAALSLLILPTFGWRVLFALGIVPALLLVWVRGGMPESARYLIGRGRIDAAERVVADIERQAHATATEPAPEFTAEVGSGQAEARGRFTVLDLLGPTLRRRTLLLWVVSFGFLWASNGILFMLPTILTQRGFTLGAALSFQLVQAIAAIFGYSACAFLIDMYGRRPVLSLYFLIGAAFHLWFAMASGAWMYAAIAAVGWVNPGVFGPSSVYAGELYPTRLRATAVGWYFGIGRIGSFLAPAVVGFMLAGGVGQYVLYTFAIAYLVSALALAAIGLETRGRVLEQAHEAAAEEQTSLAPAVG